MAFSKKEADARKTWIAGFEPGTYLDQDVAEIGYSDFVNKELILFSIASNIRAIPSMVCITKSVCVCVCVCERERLVKKKKNRWTD